MINSENGDVIVITALTEYQMPEALSLRRKSRIIQEQKQLPEVLCEKVKHFAKFT